MEWWEKMDEIVDKLLVEDQDSYLRFIHDTSSDYQSTFTPLYNSTFYGSSEPSTSPERQLAFSSKTPNNLPRKITKKLSPGTSYDSWSPNSDYKDVKETFSPPGHRPTNDRLWLNLTRSSYSEPSDSAYFTQQIGRKITKVSSLLLGSHEPAIEANEAKLNQVQNWLNRCTDRDTSNSQRNLTKPLSDSVSQYSSSDYEDIQSRFPLNVQSQNFFFPCYSSIADISATQYPSPGLNQINSIHADRYGPLSGPSYIQSSKLPVLSPQTNPVAPTSEIPIMDQYSQRTHYNQSYSTYPEYAGLEVSQSKLLQQNLTFFSDPTVMDDPFRSPRKEFHSTPKKTPWLPMEPSTSHRDNMVMTGGTSTFAPTPKPLNKFVFQQLQYPLRDQQATTTPENCTVLKLPLIQEDLNDTDSLIRNKNVNCNFCLKNGESAKVYTGHPLKMKKGRKLVITCPVLRSFVCSTCGATGDDAHTETYCPVLLRRNNGERKKSTTVTVKSTRTKSSGKRRY